MVLVTRYFYRPLIPVLARFGSCPFIFLPQAQVFLKGRIFVTTEEIKQNNYRGFRKTHILDEGWEMYVTKQGEYFEGEKVE